MMGAKKREAKIEMKIANGVLKSIPTRLKGIARERANKKYIVAYRNTRLMSISLCRIMAYANIPR